MPTRMHWVLERKSSATTWEAVLSNQALDRLRKAGSVVMGAAQRLGAPDPAFFAVMSGRSTPVRGRCDPRLEPFARKGLPDNVSSYARGTLAEPIRLASGGRQAALQDQGCIELARLSRVAAAVRQDIKPLEALSGNACAEDYLSRLWTQLQIICGNSDPESRPVPGLGVNWAQAEILFGSVVEDAQTIRHPDMESASQHVLLKMRQKLAAFPPAEPDNMRLLIAFGQ